MIKVRNLWLVGVLSVVTLSLYNVYLVYQWSKELNALEGREKHNPTVVLLVSLLTCGLGASVFECLFAHDLQKWHEARRTKPLLEPLMVVIIALNAAAWVLYAAGIGIAAGVAASVLMQREFNALAQQTAVQPIGAHDRVGV